jgi:hypothetical protein
MPVLPPLEDEEKKNRSVYMPDALWEEYQVLADRSRRIDPKGKGHSRNDLIVHAMRWAAIEYEKELSAAEARLRERDQPSKKK